MFWPRAGCGAFLPRNGQLQGKKTSRLHDSMKLKLEKKYESVEHVISFSAIKKRSKISFHRHLSQGVQAKKKEGACRLK